MGNKRKALIDMAVEVLVEKAQDAAHLARTQRATADRQQEGVTRQHESAHKLEKLSLSLTNEAEHLKEEAKLEDSKTADGDTAIVH
jgi:hypothetical protein